MRLNDAIKFGIIGSGWRSEFFLRIAREIPDRFSISGLLTRSTTKGEELQREWGCPTGQTIDWLLSTRPEFVVVSTPWAVTPVMLQELTERRMPALAETPPAPNLEALVRVNELTAQGGRIQVAEQYHMQPLHAARLQIAHSGRIGSVSQAQFSVAHGYHGVSLIRRALGVNFENATISAVRFNSPIVQSPDRGGPPVENRVTSSSQTLAWIGFEGKLGVFDFTGDQYFSWVRSPRVLIRGEKGEINNLEVRSLIDFRTPVTETLRREDTGHEMNLEGYFHKGYTLGREWVYRNPFTPGRLTDDEIAIATCLQKMSEYAQGGPDFYSLAEASQDHYLGILIDRAAASGEKIQTTTQPWSK